MTPRRTNAKRRTVTTTYPTCGDCKQRITFIRMTDTGKALPCDPWPVPDGKRERPGRPRRRPFTPQQQQLDLFGGSDG